MATAQRIDIEEGLDPSIPPDVAMFAFYRNAEQHGANLLFRLLKHLDDPDAQAMLSQHLAEETKHAWMWTDRILRAGYKPMVIADGYQTRIGRAAGIPRDVVDLLALTVVVEQRAMRRYQRHLGRKNLDADTEQVLREVTKDEAWHIDWIRKHGRELAEQRGTPERFEEAVQRFRVVDEEVTAELEAKERELLGEEYTN